MQQLQSAAQTTMAPAGGGAAGAGVMSDSSARPPLRGILLICIYGFISRLPLKRRRRAGEQLCTSGRRRGGRVHLGG